MRKRRSQRRRGESVVSCLLSDGQLAGSEFFSRRRCRSSLVSVASDALQSAESVSAALHNSQQTYLLSFLCFPHCKTRFISLSIKLFSHRIFGKIRKKILSDTKEVTVQFQKKSSIGYQRYLEIILELFSKEILKSF